MKDSNPLIAAAKAVGKVAGTVASTLGVHPEPTPPKATNESAGPAGKLQKKSKQRLPRKEKKALKRKQQAATGA